MHRSVATQFAPCYLHIPVSDLEQPVPEQINMGVPMKHVGHTQLDNNTYAVYKSDMGHDQEGHVVVREHLYKRVLAWTRRVFTEATPESVMERVGEEIGEMLDSWEKLTRPCGCAMITKEVIASLDPEETKNLQGEISDVYQTMVDFVAVCGWDWHEVIEKKLLVNIGRTNEYSRGEDGQYRRTR